MLSTSRNHFAFSERDTGLEPAALSLGSLCWGGHAKPLEGTATTSRHADTTWQPLDAHAGQNSVAKPPTPPHGPGLAKGSLQRVAGLAHGLATAALLGKTDSSAILIRRLALEASPGRAMALSCEGRAS